MLWQPSCRPTWSSRAAAPCGWRPTRRKWRKSTANSGIYASAAWRRGPRSAASGRGGAELARRTGRRPARSRRQRDLSSLCRTLLVARQSRKSSAPRFRNGRRRRTDDKASSYVTALRRGGTTVNATGTAAPGLTPGCEVRPRKGHLVITDRYPGCVRHQLVELGYLKSAHPFGRRLGGVQRAAAPNGQLLIGSSRQYGVTYSAIDAPMLTWMLRRAQEYMPGLAGLSAYASGPAFAPRRRTSCR